MKKTDNFISSVLLLTGRAVLFPTSVLVQTAPGEMMTSTTNYYYYYSKVVWKNEPSGKKIRYCERSVHTARGAQPRAYKDVRTNGVSSVLTLSAGKKEIDLHAFTCIPRMLSGCQRRGLLYTRPANVFTALSGRLSVRPSLSACLSVHASMYIGLSEPAMDFTASPAQ